MCTMAAPANVEGGARQQAHVILAVDINVREHKVPVSIMSWGSKKIIRVARPVWLLRQAARQRAWNSWMKRDHCGAR